LTRCDRKGDRLQSEKQELKKKKRRGGEERKGSLRRSNQRILHKLNRGGGREYLFKRIRGGGRDGKEKGQKKDLRRWWLQQERKNNVHLLGKGTVQGVFYEKTKMWPQTTLNTRIDQYLQNENLERGETKALVDGGGSPEGGSISIATWIKNTEKRYSIFVGGN